MNVIHIADIRASRAASRDDGMIADPHAALVALMDRYERKLFTYLITMLRDEDTVMDCVQDTFVRAYDSLRRGSAVNAKWLYTVARNRAMDEFRRDRRLEHDEGTLTRLEWSGPNVDQTLDIQAALERLPAHDREVIYLFEVAGFKTEEMGEMLGISGSAVRQRLLRARERLRHVLDRSA